VSGFIAKLRFWETQIGCGTFAHFPSLFEHKDGGSNEECSTITGDFIDEFQRRFTNIEHCLQLLKIFSAPVNINAATVPV